MFQVIDIMTGKIVATYSNQKRARTKADKLDLTYGAVRYRVQMV